MSRRNRISRSILLFSAAAFLLSASLAEANRAPSIPRPKKAAPISVKGSLDYSKKARRSTIELPRKLLAQLVAAAKIAPRKAFLTPERRTVVAGTALAMGVAFLGLWFFRKPSRRRLPLGPLLVVIGLGTMLFFAGMASGQGQPEDAGFSVNGLKVKVDRGKTVRLDINGDADCGLLLGD